MRFVLDTNTVSEFMRGNIVALEHLSRLGRNEVGIPQLVVAEIEFGLAIMPTGKRKELLTSRWRIFRDELMRIFWDDEVSREFANIKAKLHQTGTLIEDFDVAIAAHAVAQDLALVTNNQRHFARIDQLHLVDWTMA